MNLLPEIQLCREPDRILVLTEPMIFAETAVLSESAVDAARKLMPKVTGSLAMGLRMMYGASFFGIYFPDRRVWFQEQGTRPFTMNRLAGNTVPMWVEDRDGSLRRDNPKIKVRTTVDGRTQVQIFRKAATRGARKQVTKRMPGGGTRVASVPASYPGAPGRIVKRQAAQPFTTPGTLGGQIAGGNVGVRWRHPGLTGRKFLNAALTQVVTDAAMDAYVVYLADEVTFYSLVGGM